ncbi:hypothetical protein JCM6882_000586 [Rhodosporidiobolus microsporus]
MQPRPPTSRLATSSFGANRAGDRTPSPLSPTAANTGFAPFSAPLPGRGTGQDAKDGSGAAGAAAVGLGVSDVSNTVWSQAGPSQQHYQPPLPRDGVENRSPTSPPLIRTSSLPSILPIPIPTGPSSSSNRTRTSPVKSHSHLRIDASPTSALRRLSPPTSRLGQLLLATIPHRFLPTSLTDPPPFPYPKSPSLTRDPPTKRHGRRRACLATPRRFAILALIGVLLLVWYAARGPEERLERLGKWVDEASQRSWQAMGRERLVPVELPHAPPRQEVQQVREEAKVDYAEMLEKLRGADGRFEQVEVQQPEAAEPAPVALPVQPEKEEVGGEDQVAKEEEEEADLSAIVKQAAHEAAVKEAEIQEKLAMAKVVKPATKPDADSVSDVAAVAAIEAEARKALDPKKKDPSRYKRLLPLSAPSRRYLYGANFVLSPLDDREHTVVDDPELTGGKVKVPSKGKLKRLFNEGKRKYEEEEEGWRSFEWKAPKPHQSLRKFLQKLDPDELALRTWIKRLHLQPPASGVGLGATPPSSPFLPAPATDLALVSDAPSFPRGDLDKYAELLLQAEAGHAGKCQGAAWLGNYEKMHAEILSGEREPKFISYHCEQGMNCGGLGDRLLGMTSAFFLGLVTDRAFLAEWQTPIPLDIVFDSPHVNWSYSSFTSNLHPVLGEKRLREASAELDIIHFDRLSVDATFGTTSWNPKKGRKLTPGFEKRDLAYQSPWIKFFTNRGMIQRSFKYKHLQKSIDRLGLQPATAFACISQYLFKPKPPALDLISEYTSALALPTVFSVGIHVRTGDRSMKDLEYDKINTVKRHSQFFRCARELGETYAQPDQRVVFYLVTDSAHLKEDAQRVFGQRLVTTDMQPQHVHQKSGHADGVLGAVVEDWILAKTDMLVATQGKLAAFMHAKEKSTVTIFPKYNPDVMGLIGKKSHVKVDCTSPDVFTSFEELSSEWSLG